MQNVSLNKEEISVDKRKEENLRVKKSITNTLFCIMQKKSLSEITITELVRGAGVARASFYRNYCSKEDVLLTLIRDVLELFSHEIQDVPYGIYAYENIFLSFKYFDKYRDYILDLYHSGFGMILQEEINHFHESIEGTMSASSVEKYALYMYSGALFNTAITWLCDRKAVSTEEIADFFFHKIAKFLDHTSGLYKSES